MTTALVTAQSLQSHPSLFYTTADVPGASATVVNGIDYPGADWTWATRVNDGGPVVGLVTKGRSESGFSYDGANFTLIGYPWPKNAAVEGMNNAGQLVGTDEGSQGIFHGFVYGRRTKA